MISTLFYFLIALIILITVHEFGHFWVARLCGVKVLRFSIGFGKPLFSWRDKKETEYAIAMVPIGGYVKMLDEAEGPVAEQDLPLAFSQQPVYKRIAIVIAGPLFNFIFAIFAIWLMYVIGIFSMAPIIQDVMPNSIVAQAGVGKNQEIIKFDEKPINSWREFQYAAMPLLGSSQKVSLIVKSLESKQTSMHQLDLNDWQLDTKQPDILQSLGIKPFIPTVPPIVGQVHEGMPAYDAGVQVGDKIIKVQDKPIIGWMQLVRIVTENPGKSLSIVIVRKGVEKQLFITPKKVERSGKLVGMVGLTSEKPNWPSSWLREKRYSLLGAVWPAVKHTSDLTLSTVTLIGRFLTGQLSVKNISGPVGIAQGAGQSGRNGFTYYLAFLALVSISLGVLNLLPIPMLDGGHLIYYLFEIVLGRPVSEYAKTIGFNIGLLLLVALMVVAMVNDFSRLMS